MIDPADLVGLLRSYCEGDVLARKVLLDVLGEEGDARVEQVREERIDWDRLAAKVAEGSRLNRSFVGFNPIWEPNRVRWFIDCARFGSDAPEPVVEAVSQERKNWLLKLFPECAEMWD